MGLHGLAADQQRDEGGHSQRHQAHLAGRHHCLSVVTFEPRPIAGVRLAVSPYHLAREECRAGGRPVCRVEQGLEASGGGNRVVVHQPYPVRPARVGAVHPVVEASGAALVGAQCEDLHVVVVLTEHLAGPIGAGVVDHQDAVGCPGLVTQRRQALDQEGAAVVSYDHSTDVHGARLLPRREHQC